MHDKEQTAIAYEKRIAELELQVHSLEFRLQSMTRIATGYMVENVEFAKNNVDRFKLEA